MRHQFLRAAAGNGGEPPWTPAEITTALWLKADDASTITESGGDVSQWNDKSGNGRNFTATGATQPTYTAAGLNGKAVLDFVLDYMNSASAASTWTFLHDATGSSVFLVVKPTGPGLVGTAIGTVGSIGVGTAGFSISTDTGFFKSLAHVVMPDSGTQVVSNTSQNPGFLPENQYSVVGVIGDPSASPAADRSSMYVNDVSPPEKSNISVFPLFTGSPTHTMQIGATGNNGQRFTGGIAEVVIVSGIISDANRERMSGYLAHEWGRASLLPSDHPYKNSPPTI